MTPPASWIDCVRCDRVHRRAAPHLLLGQDDRTFPCFWVEEEPYLMGEAVWRSQGILGAVEQERQSRLAEWLGLKDRP